MGVAAEAISVEASFFELGGNSLQAVRLARELAAALGRSVRPADVVAHRVGDFVFTYHGMDFSASDPGLWTVILSFAPDSSAAQVAQRAQQTYWAGLLDGTVVEFPAADLSAELATQNALRAGEGLPALPDPATVTHVAPARRRP